jgi:plastocyanin
MKKLSALLFLGVAVLAVTCSQQPTSPAATPGGNSTSADVSQGGGRSPLSATMDFGLGNVGSPFPPGSGHDSSAHAADNVVPQNVVIGRGGTVTFKVPPAVHQIAIYDDGTQPEDIDTSIVTTLNAYAGCPGPPTGPPVVFAPLVINDPTNRIADYPIPCFQPATRTHPFPNAGKFLVICSFLPHFEVGMYGWVTVRN